jgi:DNA-binding PadR family transcriptional regulator
MNDIMTNEIRKGFLKMFILRVIQERPSHGYEIIHEIEARTEGHWTPSPGSIYPALEHLEKKGYISGEESDRKKIYTITPTGVSALQQVHERKKQFMLELTALFGENLEEKND